MVFGYNAELSHLEIEENVFSKKFPISSGPMDSPWPMKCHDLHHTGLSPYNTASNPGIEKWRFNCGRFGRIAGSPVISDDSTIYIGDGANYLNAINPDGTLKWRYKTGESITSAPAIAEDGTIYVGSWDHYLHAIYSNNGTRKWIFNANDANIASSPAIGADGTIYFGTLWSLGDGGKIFAVNPDGTEKWVYQTGDAITSDPAIGDDGTVYIGSMDNYLYALYPNGTLRWRFKTGDAIKGPPSIDIDGTIYVGSYDDYLYALYPNGTLNWKCKIGYGTETNPSISSDGTIYVGGQKLYAINPGGTIKWTFDLGSERRIRFSSPAISADGTIYVGLTIGETYGGELIAVHLNGTEKWRSEIISNEWIDSSPCIGEDGTVYIGSYWKVEFEPDKWTSWGYLHAFGKVESNNQPTPPDVDGPTQGNYLWDQTYYFSATDPDNNPVSFYIDWGDGTNSGWVGPYASGESRFLQHKWSQKGTYTIKAKARDTLGEESDWTILEVSMPKSNAIFTPFFSILENHPHLFPILRQLLGL
jgi:outer membrane protein assembly factor BamB